MASDLQARLRNSETSLLFMQQEHAKTLEGLHNEIQKLQEKCADLTFRLAMEETSRSSSDADVQRHNDELQSLLRQRDDRLLQLEDALRERDGRLQAVVRHLERERETRARESASFLERERTLKAELEARAGRVAFLTAEMHKFKVNRGSSGSGGSGGADAALITVQPDGAVETKFKRAPPVRASTRDSARVNNDAPRSMRHLRPLSSSSPAPRTPRRQVAPFSSESSFQHPSGVDETSSKRVVAAGGRRFRQIAPDEASRCAEEGDDAGGVGGRGAMSLRPTPPVLPPIFGPTGRQGGGSGGGCGGGGSGGGNRLNTNNNNNNVLLGAEEENSRKSGVIYEDVSIIDLGGVSGGAFGGVKSSDSDAVSIGAEDDSNDADAETTPGESSTGMALASSHLGGLLGGLGDAGANLEGPVLVRKARVRTVNRKDLARHHQAAAASSQGGARSNDAGDLTLDVLAIDAADRGIAKWSRRENVPNNPTTP